MYGGNAGHGETANGGAPEPAPSAPSVSPELIDRFKALIEEVTDELMQGRETNDRTACRADAIAILTATCRESDEAGESPLLHLLAEEQRKAEALLCAPESCAFTLMKA